MLNYKYTIEKTDEEFENIYYTYVLYYSPKYNKIMYCYKNNFVGSFRKYFKEINNDVLNIDVKQNISLFFIIEALIKKNHKELNISKPFKLKINKDNIAHYFFINKEVFV